MSKIRIDEYVAESTDSSGIGNGSANAPLIAASEPGWISPLVVNSVTFDAAVLAAAYRGRGVEAVAPSGALDINLATGQNAAGVIQTAGDLADAHWTVSTSAMYKQAPIAFTVAPGDVDWYSHWAANGPSSSWIAADPDNSDNGNVTYTVTFSLTGFNPADATLSGGQFKVDDAGSVYLNGHLLGTQAYNGWNAYTLLSNGAGDFVSGVNTLVIKSTSSDFFDEAARFEGTVVDSVGIQPGPIHWANPVSGSFDTAADWAGGLIPGTTNDADIDASGSTSYIVTASANEAVRSINTDATATLDITGGLFAVSAGGQNSGAIDIESGDTLSLAGTLTNYGGVAMNGAATMVIAQDATLKGGGVVTFGTAAGSQITGAGGAATLTNVDNTLSGCGLIGGGDLTFVNGVQGVIDGATSGVIINASGGTDSNAGLIESSGTLTLETGSFSNAGTVNAQDGLVLNAATLDDRPGGVIAVSSGVVMTNSAILGGALTFGEGPALFVNGADTIDAALTNESQMLVNSGASLSLQGAFDNNASNIRFAPTAISASITIDTGANTVLNTGHILANGPENLVTIESALDNDGLLKVYNGTMIVDGAVTGTGRAVISGGVMEISGAFHEQVGFQRDVGELVLTQSQNFAGEILHFSTDGGSSIDLRDIGFVTSGEATFSGDSRSGLLTVTDGTHTAVIKLKGDYAGESFVASSDGQGGALVVAQASAMRFASAAAGLTEAPSATAISTTVIAAQASNMLTRPALSGG